MDTNRKGNIGEAKVLSYFIQEGYEVYIPFGTATTNDLVVIKDNKSYRVSVKSTSTRTDSGKWEVRIRQSSHKGRTLFDKNKTDLLAIYIIPEDRIVILNSQDISTVSSISIS